MGCCLIATALTSANGWEEGDFVVCGEWRGPGGEFLIAGGNQRGAIVRELGVLRGVARKKGFDWRVRGEVDIVFGAAEDFFKAPEEEDFDADGRGCGWHGLIVACVGGGG
jgi:hypothetical protein